MKTDNLTFGEAIEHLKKNSEYSVTRKNWYGSSACPRVYLQRPENDLKMTEPFLYMVKKVNNKLVRFPLAFSCESILAEDWMIVI